jgi:chromosomal replication initiation ATPase DnaA
MKLSATYTKEGIMSNLDRAESIKNVVSIYMKVDLEDMESKSRQRAFTEARQIAMYFIHKLTTLSLRDIGSLFGNRDHSTVLHSRDVISDQLEVNKPFKKMIEDLEGMVLIAARKHTKQHCQELIGFELN